MKKWIALLLCGILVWTSLACAMAQGFAGLMDDEAPAGTEASGMAGLMDDEAEEEESSDPVFTLPYPVNSDSAQALEPSQESIESAKQNGKATYRYHLDFGTDFLKTLTSAEMLTLGFGEWLVENEGFELVYQDTIMKENRSEQYVLLDHPSGNGRYLYDGHKGHLLMMGICDELEDGCHYSLYLYYKDPLQYEHTEAEPEEEEEPGIPFTLPPEAAEADMDRDGYESRLWFEDVTLTEGRQLDAAIVMWLVDRHGFEIDERLLFRESEDGFRYFAFLKHPEGGEDCFSIELDGIKHKGHVIVETICRKEERRAMVTIVFDEPFRYVQ